MKIDKLQRGENSNHNYNNDFPSFPAYRDLFELYDQVRADKVDQSSHINSAPAEIRINDSADDDTVWSFDAILDHQGPIRK